MPAPILWVVANIVFWVHSDWWAFGCCDRQRKVKAPFIDFEPDVRA